MEIFYNITIDAFGKIHVSFSIPHDQIKVAKRILEDGEDNYFDYIENNFSM